MLGHSPLSALPICGAPLVVVTAPVAAVPPSGGYKREPSSSLLSLHEGRRQTQDERIAARRAFMGLPAKAIKVIKRVALEQVEDPGKPQEALVQALEEKNLAFRAKYVEALKAEIARLHDVLAREEDDEETLLLLM